MLKTVGGSVAGLTTIILGWLIFSNNGYDSALLFLVGSLLLPVGVFTLGTALTGGFGEGIPTILRHYRGRVKATELTR